MNDFAVWPYWKREGSENTQMASKTCTEQYARGRFSRPCRLQMEKTQQVGKKIILTVETQYFNC